MLQNESLVDYEVLNESLTFNETFSTEEGHNSEVSTVLLAIYFGNVAIATVFNAISFLAILRSKRNGTLSIVLQMSATDILTTFVCVIEIWAVKCDTWPFTVELCPLFSGMEIFTNTMTLYLVLLLNCHTISLCNMKTHDTDACDASNECLVRDSRSITIDYRPRQNEVSVIFPCILVWFMCLSLSIPSFTLSSTLSSSVSNVTVCTVADLYYGRLLGDLLTSFRVYIPIIALLLTVCVLSYKLYEYSRKNTVQNIFTRKSQNVVYYLMFCLAINFAYLLTSLQRPILYSLHATDDVVRAFESYKTPPLHNGAVGYRLRLLSSSIHYSGAFIRFPIYFFLLPKFKSLIINKTLMCFKSRN